MYWRQAETGLTLSSSQFGTTEGDTSRRDFLNEILPWLDEQDYVERYAYFGLQEELGLLNDGNGALTDLGKTYADTS